MGNTKKSRLTSDSDQTEIDVDLDTADDPSSSDDDTEPIENDEPIASTSKPGPSNNDTVNPGADTDFSDEYYVETIKDSRFNSKTGEFEYLIKWENYADKDNTWEPESNLKCPDKVGEFERQRIERLKNENGGNQLNQPSPSSSVTPRRRTRHSKAVVLRDDSSTDEDVEYKVTPNVHSTPTLRAKNRIDYNEAVLSVGGADPTEQQLIPEPMNGFLKGYEIDKIVGATFDQDQQLHFFIKWKDIEKVEMIPTDELERRAPIYLCRYYRKLLYKSLSLPFKEQYD